MKPRLEFASRGVKFNLLLQDSQRQPKKTLVSQVGLVKAVAQDLLEEALVSGRCLAKLPCAF